jgi:hypothetical protein
VRPKCNLWGGRDCPSVVPVGEGARVRTGHRAPSRATYNERCTLPMEYSLYWSLRCIFSVPVEQAWPPSELRLLPSRPAGRYVLLLFGVLPMKYRDEDHIYLYVDAEGDTVWYIRCWGVLPRGRPRSPTPKTPVPSRSSIIE